MSRKEGEGDRIKVEIHIASLVTGRKVSEVEVKIECCVCVCVGVGVGGAYTCL